jgi:protein dithiol oxidoreductase (disulfide-forming)
MQSSALSSKWIKACSSILFSAMAAFAASAYAQEARNPDIKPLDPPQTVDNDGKIEVLEFFGYGCIHCAHLEPRLHDWVKKLPADVKFVRVPVPAPHKGVSSIPIFYTLQAMGEIDRLHQKIFDAIHVENVIMGNPATLNKWLEKNGVDPKKFEEVQRSFSVQGKIRRAEKMSGDYKIAATPSLIVHGRYAIEQQAGPDRLFASVEQAIGMARASMKATAPATEPAKKAPAKK